MGGRGRRHDAETRQEVLGLIDEAVAAGARQWKACEWLGLSVRTVQRWRAEPEKQDGRRGPSSSPKNKLSDSEREAVLTVARSEEYRDLSPCQIVPKLADVGEYVASESSFYRILREEKEQNHRGRSKPRTHAAPLPKVANGPCELWSWDITYLYSPVRGMFFYLYLIMDVWSRKIVGASVEERECSDLAANLVEDAVSTEGADGELLILHSDNGSPMKGSTMVAKLNSLGIKPSFSRPSVSNDNPFSESLFRTLKYRPEYPDPCFESLGAARIWVDEFIQWYNEEHRHSSLRFVSPAARQDGREAEILKRREEVYKAARERHPERWTGDIRNWDPKGPVTLNKKGKDMVVVAKAA